MTDFKPDNKSHAFITNVNTDSKEEVSGSIKAVAIYEVIKGLSALCSAVALWYWHDNLLAWLNTIEARIIEQFGDLFITQTEALIRAAQKANQNWKLFFVGILVYALFRFIQAYGLWQGKTWAYWFGILGYAVFIPIEVYYLIVRPFDWFKLLVLVLNIIVVFVVYRQMRNKGLI